MKGLISIHSEKRKIWNGKRKHPFQIFLFSLFRETRGNTFLKNSLTPRGNQLHSAYFSFNQDGMSDQNRWHNRKVSKIKASSGFWGRFSKPQKIQFYRWHSVFEVKKRFSGSEMKKNLTAFFSFQNLTKKRFSKLQPFFEKNLKKFLKSVKIMMKNVAKV